MTQHNEFVTNNFSLLTTMVGNKTRKVAHNTTIRYNPGLYCFEITYHYSVIVRIWNDNSISLYAYKWQTPTTKERLNWYAHLLGWTIYQEKFTWFAWQYTEKSMKNEVEFYDNLHIGSDGELIEPDYVNYYTR